MKQYSETGLDTLLWGCRIEKNKIIKAKGGVLPGQVLELLLGSLFPTASPPAQEVSADRSSAARRESSALKQWCCLTASPRLDTSPSGGWNRPPVLDPQDPVLGSVGLNRTRGESKA